MNRRAFFRRTAGALGWTWLAALMPRRVFLRRPTNNAWFLVTTPELEPIARRIIASQGAARLRDERLVAVYMLNNGDIT